LINAVVIRTLLVYKQNTKHIVSLHSAKQCHFCKPTSSYRLFNIANFFLSWLCWSWFSSTFFLVFSDALCHPEFAFHM